VNTIQDRESNAFKSGGTIVCCERKDFLFQISMKQVNMEKERDELIKEGRRIWRRIENADAAEEESAEVLREESWRRKRRWDLSGPPTTTTKWKMVWRKLPIPNRWYLLNQRDEDTSALRGTTSTRGGNAGRNASSGIPASGWRQITLVTGAAPAAVEWDETQPVKASGGMVAATLAAVRGGVAGQARIEGF
jgi:hypothetical protein